MIHQSPPLPGPLIVGCWQLDERSWRSHSESDITRAIDTYLARRIIAFDTADIYGRSEQMLGRILKGRDCEVFTKAVFWGNPPTPTHVRHKVEASLRNLKRDYLDCIQIHWHDPQLDFAPTFAMLKDLLDEGKIRRLGVTNFDTPMLEKALNYAPISTHQVQYSLIDRRVENRMQSFCQQHDIGLLPYGPLAGGFLSDKYVGVANPKLEPDHARSFYYSSMIKRHGGWKSVLDLLDVLSEIAHAYHKTVSQVALNWLKQQPGVACIVSGLTLNREQIKQNAESLTWTLDSSDVQRLSEKSAALFDYAGDIYSYER
ncbi:MAG: aldo/keto reductase [Elainellaceae cyanobacterium]